MFHKNTLIGNNAPAGGHYKEQNMIYVVINNFYSKMNPTIWTETTRCCGSTHLFIFYLIVLVNYFKEFVGGMEWQKMLNFNA